MATPTKKLERRESYNPLLKSYPDSEKINSVSEGAEVLYVRLIAASDDLGRYWAEPKLVLGKLFTHRWQEGTLDVKAVDLRLNELERVGLIRFYCAEGRRYLEMIDVVKRLRPDLVPNVFCPSPPDARRASAKRALPVAHPAHAAAPRKPSRATASALRRTPRKSPNSSTGNDLGRPACAVDTVETRDSVPASLRRRHDVDTTSGRTRNDVDATSSRLRAANPTQTQPNPTSTQAQPNTDQHPHQCAPPEVKRAPIDAPPNAVVCGEVFVSKPNASGPTATAVNGSSPSATHQVRSHGAPQVPSQAAAQVPPQAAAPVAAPVAEAAVRTIAGMSPAQLRRVHFEQFWRVYPARRGRKIGPHEARRAFYNLAAVDVQSCIEAARNYSREMNAAGKPPRDAALFLAGDYWRAWLGDPESEPSVRYVDPNSQEACSWSAE